MKKFSSLLFALGAILFFAGNLINLIFSSNLMWGEMEAQLFRPQSNVRSLRISCPLLIAPNEEASIQTIITNSINKETKPQVNAFMSQRPEARVETDTLILAPFESQSLEWITNRSNIVFDRLILVSIFQRQYQELEARHGSCSIYVYSIFGLNGKSTLIAIIEIGVLSALLGIGLLYYVLQPFSARAKKLMGANSVFVILVLLGLFSAFPRLWGLTLMFNSMAVLAIIVAYVDILLRKN